jgi:hypothetical protein
MAESRTVTLSHDENLPDERLRLKVDDVVWRAVGDELVVLELATATYLTLNGTAKLLWEELADGSSVSGLVASLCTRYGITEGQARSDVESFMAVLAERGLIARDA